MRRSDNTTAFMQVKHWIEAYGRLRGRGVPHSQAADEAFDWMRRCAEEAAQLAHLDPRAR